MVCFRFVIAFAVLTLLAPAPVALAAPTVLIHDCVRVQSGVNAWVEVTVTSDGGICTYTYVVTNNDRLPGPDAAVCTADDTFPSPAIGVPRGLRIFGLEANAPLTQALTTNWNPTGTLGDPPDDPGPITPPMGTNTHWSTLCSLDRIPNGGSEVFVLTSKFLPEKDQWYLRDCAGTLIRSQTPAMSLAVPGTISKVPTLSQWGLAILTLTILMLGLWVLRRRTGRLFPYRR